MAYAHTLDRIVDTLYADISLFGLREERTPTRHDFGLYDPDFDPEFDEYEFEMDFEIIELHLGIDESERE